MKRREKFIVEELDEILLSFEGPFKGEMKYRQLRKLG